MRAKMLRVMDVGGLPRVFWWVWLGTLINRTGAFVAPFLSFYLTKSQGFSPAFAGFVAALNAVGAAISAVVGGVLADRIGRRPTLLGAQIASAAALVALGMVHTPVLIAAFAFGVGLANNATRPATGAIIADVVPASDRARAYALNYWAINLGFSVAMFIAGALASHSYALLFFGEAVALLASAVLVFFTIPESRPEVAVVVADGAAAEEAETGSLADVFRDKIFMGFLGAILLGAIVYTQSNTTQPISMGRDGLGPGAYGAVAAINGILIGVFQLPMTTWMRRFSHGSVLAVSAFFMGAGFAVPLLVPVLGHPMGVYVVSVVVWTLAEIGTTPPQMALGADLAPAHMRGRYQGMGTLVWSIAGVVGPLLGGWALSTSGPAAVAWASLLLGVVGVPAWILIDRASRERVAAAQAAPDRRAGAAPDGHAVAAQAAADQRPAPAEHAAQAARDQRAAPAEPAGTGHVAEPLPEPAAG